MTALNMYLYVLVGPLGPKLEIHVKLILLLSYVLSLSINTSIKGLQSRFLHINKNMMLMNVECYNQ